MKKTQKTEFKRQRSIDRKLKTTNSGRKPASVGQKKSETTPRSGNLLLVSTALFLLVIATLTAASYARNSIYKNIVTLWTSIVKSSPSKRRAHENLGQALSTFASVAVIPEERSRYLSAALHEFQTVQALPDDGSVPLRDLYREIGVVYFRMSLYNDAIQAWQTGLHYAAGDPSLLNNLSIVLMQTGRYDEAAGAAQTALAADPDMPQALNTMGQVAMLKKDYDKAVEYFLRAMEREPDNVQRYWNIALAYEQARKYDLALQYATNYANLATDPAARQQATMYVQHLKQMSGR